MLKAIVKEIVCSTASETRPRSGTSSKWAITGSPIHPSASEASVMPRLCRRDVGVEVIDLPQQALARRSPLSASAAMRERRTPTSANSKQTKNPFAKTSRKTKRILSALT